jgi:hypothetical protein
MLPRRFPGLGFERHRKVTGAGVARSIFVLEGAAAWRRLGGAKALAELGVVDGPAVTSLVERVLKEATPPERNQHAYRVWDIVALEAWTRDRVQ